MNQAGQIKLPGFFVMIAILSPSKTMDFSPSNMDRYTVPPMLPSATQLAKNLKSYSSEELRGIMKMSDKLADETRHRFGHFNPAHTIENSKQAAITYTGDVYRGLQAHDWSEEEMNFAQDHLVILSGLYGALRPMDLIQPYRLELGARYTTEEGKNLYQYWRSAVNAFLKKQVGETGSNVLVNLASDEYAKIVDPAISGVHILTIGFKEFKNGKLRFMSFHAKKARGLFARYIVKHQIEQTNELKGFNSEGYSYSEEHSSADHWVFIR